MPIFCGEWSGAISCARKKRHLVLHIFARNLHTLQGLFRNFTGTVARGHTKLLHALKNVVKGKTPNDIIRDVIRDARWNTVWNRGSALLEKHGSGPPGPRGTT